MSYQQEQVREWTWVFGAEHPDREWINSPFDSWEKNPHYTGPKGRHPEDDYEEGYDHKPEGEDIVLVPMYEPMFEPDADDIPF